MELGATGEESWYLALSGRASECATVDKWHLERKYEKEKEVYGEGKKVSSWVLCYSFNKLYHDMLVWAQATSI